MSEHSDVVFAFLDKQNDSVQGATGAAKYRHPQYQQAELHV